MNRVLLSESTPKRTTVQDLRTISEEVDVRGKRVFVRIDSDVAISAAGEVEPGGEFRLFGCTETVLDLIKRGARVILAGHVGRPDGKVVEQLRTKYAAERLAKHFGVPIRALSVVVGPEVKEAVFGMNDGEIIFLENLRFDSREEKNDPTFASELASLAQVYVDESFANSHRDHASVTGITEYLPSYAGKLFAKEINTLESVLVNPKRPVAAAISGAKIETKAALLVNLLPQIDFLLTGGGIANMFIQTQGIQIGRSIAEPSMEQVTKDLWEKYKEKIYVPSDVRVARKNPQTGKDEAVILNIESVTAEDAIYDVGPMTLAKYCNVLSMAKTFVWNGPIGKVELPDFQEGTRALAKCARSLDAFSIVGGGDTVAALYNMKSLEGFAHVSTGGGAMISFLQGDKLPAVEVLRS